MKKLFVDTGAFVARALVKDQFHPQAVVAWRRLEQRGEALVTTEHVFDESVTLLSRRASVSYASEWASVHLNSKCLSIAQTEEGDLEAAIRVLKKFADQKLSFTDAISMAFMKRNALKRAFAFDDDFRRAGFEIWP